MEYNPYELIYMSRTEDASALAALFAQYQSYFLYLRDTVTKRNHPYGEAEEEILLEMRIGLLEACQRYREDQPASWRTFLTVVLKRRAVNVLRKADIRDWREYTMSFDALVKEEESVYECFSQTDRFAEPEYCMHYAEARNKLERVIQKMDQEEQTYVYLWTKNASCAEGSTMMNCTPKKWYKQMEKIKSRVYAEIQAES